MLSKFIAIDNVGNFRHARGSGDVTFKKLNLIHGDNGRGKSTICAILRSLRANDPTLVIERKTLDGDGDPHIQLLGDTGTNRFAQRKWNSSFPHLEIFDAEFVNSNVFSGDAITHDHKRNLCAVVLGAEGVKLADVCVKLDIDERDAIRAVSTAEVDVKGLFKSAVLTSDAFVALAEDSDVDNKIEEKKSQLRAIHDLVAIRQKPLLERLSIAVLPNDLVTILTQAPEKISKDAERLVELHLVEHKMQQRGQLWLAEGLGYIVENRCPMCRLDLQKSDFVRHLSDLFSPEYRGYRDEVATIAKSFAAICSDAALVAAQKPLANNLASIEFWKHYTDQQAPEISFEKFIQPIAIRVRDAIAPLFEMKMSSPFERIDISPSASSAIADWNRLREAVAVYNTDVEAFNQHIAAIKSRAESKSGLAIEQELSVLEARKSRYSEAGKTAVQRLAEAQLRKAEIEFEKAKAKHALAEYNEKIIEAYRDSVNHLLEKFGAAFRLSKVRIEYPGGKPRAGYAFEIRGRDVDPGSEETAGVPCFRNTLSSGDRNTLAFAFFLAQIQSRSDLSGLVLVLDDPFTSLDEFRQKWTCYAISKLAAQAKQVIVFSHSVAFLRTIEQFARNIATKCLKIDFVGSGDSDIVECDLESATAKNVDRNVMTLKEYYYAETNDSLAAVRAIRPALENYIRSVAPEECPTGEGGWLGTFLGQINSAEAGSPLMVFKVKYDEFNFLNEVTKGYHHDPETAPPLNEPEVRGWVEMCLKVIHRIPAS